jgi:predicted metalloprotease
VNFPRTLSGKYEPVTDLYSYDSHDPESPMLCGNDTYELTNAFFCGSDRLIAWDRGVFLPTVQKYFGDMAVTGVLSHEYGHAIQRMAHLVKRSTTVLVAEQCVARADRYSFTAFSDNEADVKQQIAAQYRILAGK